MSDLAVVLIGAGNVNFGGGEGPWDHATRMEQLGGVRVTGVADADPGRARSAIQSRQGGPCPPMWQDAKAFADWREMVDTVEADAAVIGIPPAAHGGLDGPEALELILARRGIAMLLEKPLGVVSPRHLGELSEQLEQAGAIVSVGYMFRYARAVNRMRELLDEAPGGPKVFLARYDCAYSDIAKPAWWDMQRSGGPIIEQATHFLDLARFLCGEADSRSVQVTRIEATDPAGMLTDLPTDETGAPIDAAIHEDHRNPRATLAQWRFAGGAVGSLSHAILLHGRKYEAELEVWADGVRCVLADPYAQCRLGVRRSGSDETEWEDFDDDPYLAEMQAFLQAARTRSSGPIRSSYADALETYRLSWAITHGPA